MKAYVINLEKDIDRRNAMERELAGTPFADAEFVKSIDGRLMSETELKEAFDYEKFAMRHIGRPQPGEVGCALSHRIVWQKIANEDSPAVVFEDDVTFEGSWDDILSFALPWLDSERPRTLLMPRHFFYARLRRAIGEGKVARPIQGFGAECYMMNAVAARLLVALGRPSFIADEWDYFARAVLICWRLFRIRLILILVSTRILFLVNCGAMIMTGQCGLLRIPLFSSTPLR